MNKAIVLLGVLVVFALLSQAKAEEVLFDRHGKKVADSEVNSDAVNWKLLKINENKAWNGFGLLDLGLGGCSMTLLDTGASGNTPAYILTNGHCAGTNLLGREEIVVNRPAPAGMAARFNYFIDAEHNIRTIPVRRIVYATMKFTDIAIMELAVPYEQLVREGFTSYRIAEVLPDAGEPVEMIGVPGSGVTRSKRFLRRSTCELGNQIDLREGGYYFRQAFRHQCSSVGGSSGSAMVSRKSGRIIAINNTGVKDGTSSEPECSLNRPCEVDAKGGISTNIVVNYAQRVTDIPGCFDGDGVFDLGLENCLLEKP